MVATQSKAGFFRLSSSRFAVDQMYLRQVLKVPELTKVPRSHPSFVGLFAVRGSIVPLLDLAQVLGLPAPVAAPDMALMIDYKQRVFAFRVDEMLGLFPYTLPEQELPYSSWVFGKPLGDTFQSLLLDIPTVSTKLDHYLGVV
jgi:two-component system, chemotaxis family, chemotaxis protein CheV